MRYTISASALVVSLLAKDVVAGVHRGHRQFHEKKDIVDVTVTLEEVDTITVTDWVTVYWGEDAATTAAVVPTTPVQVVVVPTTTSSAYTAPLPVTPIAAPPVAAPVVQSSSVAAADSPGVFVPLPSTPVVQPTVAAPVVQTTPPVVVHSTTAAPPSAPSSAPPPSSPSTGKRGLAYQDASLTTNFLFPGSKVSWAYNWGATTSGLSPVIDYIPTLWGLTKDGTDHTQGWAKNAAAAIASGSKYLFCFNEPDLPAQSNLSPAAAAAGFKTYMMPFAGQAKLGAPSVTNGGAPMGLAWTTSFLQACTGCQIDFCNVHWYDSASNVPYFKSYIADAYTACGGRPIFLTEFAASGSADEQVTFLKTVLPWLDSLSYIEGYAYFMVEDGVLLSSGNALSTLGTTYASI